MGFLSSITGGISDLLGGSVGDAAGSMLGVDGLALGLGQSLLNFGSTERANSMNRKHDWALWNAQNEYNKPINQMARLREAGLNPNLVYGSGATALAAPTHSSTATAARIDALEQIGAYQNLKQQDAMTQQIKAQTKLVKTQEANTYYGGVWNDMLSELGFAERLQNLNYAMDHNLPVGAMPSMDATAASIATLPGGKITRGQRAKWISRFVKNRYKNAHLRRYDATFRDDYDDPRKVVEAAFSS